MGVAPGFEGLLENEVSIGMINDHDILVTRAGFDKEVASVICVELAERVDIDVDFTGWGLSRWEDQWGKTSHGNPGLGRAHILALLRKVAQDSFVSIGAVSHDVGVGETIKRIKVACLDGIQPCLFDREANAHMIEASESSDAGEIEAPGVEGRTGNLGCKSHCLSRRIHK